MPRYIYGRNPVKAAIASGQTIEIYVSKQFKDREILSSIERHKLSLQRFDNLELAKLVNTIKHQGIVAKVKEYHYYSLSELINEGKEQNNPTIIMLDGINDPHNFGAILRVADAFNALGVIIKNNDQVSVNSTVVKVSTGAASYVKVAMVSNLNDAIMKLKKEGYWIVSTDGDATTNYTDLKYDFPAVLVIGSEGKGISHLIKTNSDYLVKIPMYGHVNSLNASNALSVVISFVINSKFSH